MAHALGVCVECGEQAGNSGRWPNRTATGSHTWIVLPPRAKPHHLPPSHVRGWPCARPALVQKGKKSGKKQTVKFVLDCSAPVNDAILDVASFEKFLHDHIKVNGKPGLSDGGPVSLSHDKTKISISAELPFAKRCVQRSGLSQARDAAKD